MTPKKSTATKKKAASRKTKKSKKSGSKKKKKKKEEKPSLRIKLRAYDHKIIDKSAREIIDIALRYGAEVVGPVPLPTEIHKFTVNRSTFIHEDSREQYEMRIHKRLIDILSPSTEILDALKDLTLPSGVDIQIVT